MNVARNDVHVRVDEKTNLVERRSFRFERIADQILRLRETALQHRQVHVFLAAEVMKQGRLLNPDPVGDLVQLGSMVTVLCEKELGDLQNALSGSTLVRYRHGSSLPNGRTVHMTNVSFWTDL